MKTVESHRMLRNPSWVVVSFLLILLLALSQGAAVYTVSANQLNRDTKKTEEGKKGEAILLLSASATLTSFQLHFETLARIMVELAPCKEEGQKVFHHCSTYLNNYFQALFHFIIASEAP